MPPPEDNAYSAFPGNSCLWHNKKRIGIYIQLYYYLQRIHRCTSPGHPPAIPRPYNNFQSKNHTVCRYNTFPIPYPCNISLPFGLYNPTSSDPSHSDKSSENNIHTLLLKSSAHFLYHPCGRTLPYGTSMQHYPDIPAVPIKFDHFCFDTSHSRLFPAQWHAQGGRRISFQGNELPHRWHEVRWRDPKNLLPHDMSSLIAAPFVLFPFPKIPYGLTDIGKSVQIPPARIQSPYWRHQFPECASPHWDILPETGPGKAPVLYIPHGFCCAGKRQTHHS